MRDLHPLRRFEPADRVHRGRKIRIDEVRIDQKRAVAPGLAGLDGEPKGPAPKRTRKRSGSASKEKAPSGKAGTILALLSRPKGARINELQKATGWQAHSIRAAITGLRKRGITVTRSQEEGGTVYRADGA